MSLLNSFVDSITCVGFNSDNGITVDSESKNNGSLFKSSLQSSVLAIVTGNRAMYPQSRGSEFIDPSYPPINRTNSLSSAGSVASSGRSTPLSTINSSLRIQRQHMIPAHYNNLPFFCFPDGARATFERENEKIHYLVFTQEEGKRSYAVAFTFQQAFTIKTDKPDDDGIYQIDDFKPSTTNTRRLSVSKIPVAIEKQQVESPPSTPTTKTRSRKMPSSFHYGDPNSTNKSQSTNSNDSNKQHPRYATPTFSSYMKNLSPSAAPPPTRLTRANSQSDLSRTNSRTDLTRTDSQSNLSRTNSRTDLTISNDTSSNSTSTRPRSNSILSRRSSMSNTTTSTSTSIEIFKPFYLPHSIVIISTQPYWTAMQEIISIIHNEIIQSKIEPYSTAYKRLIQKYAYLACNTPVPPIPWERFSIAFYLTYEQSILTFDPPININRTPLDLDLSIVLLTVNIGKLLDILAAIFTEQPIIFFSSNYSTLVKTLECFHYLIYPLKWKHVYVPLVPDGLRYYYLEDPPGTYIMGTHSRYQKTVEELGISLTCNLDNDKHIRVPKKFELYPIPPTKLHRFINPITKLIEEIKVSRSLQNVHTPVRLRLDEQREFERQKLQETNHRIMKIFLDLMIDLCGDALKPIYWKVNHQISPTNTLTKTQSNASDTKNSNHIQTTTFSKEKYLMSKTEGAEIEFYRTFVNTSAFQRLIEEENISILPTAFRQICQIHLSSNEDQLYDFNETSSEDNDENDINSTDILGDSISSQMVLPLPDWPTSTSTHYLDSCIDIFTHELKSAQEERSPSVISIYAYLRGCALLARGQYLDGLRDLYLIENPNLFPLDYIEKTIVPQLIDECLLDLFLHEPFYMKSPEWKKVRTRPTSQNLSIIDIEESGKSLDDAKPVESLNELNRSNSWDVVQKSLTYQEFSEHVHHLSIVLDKETTETLFNALLHWTDNTISKTLKKDKTLTNNTNKSSDTAKPLRRRWSTSTNSLKDALTMANDYQQGNQNPVVTPKSSLKLDSSLPAALFESFVDIWQQTNAVKIKMIRCLPEDRQKQESILKVSSSDILSKKDGPGQLILTQKRLYFLPESRTLARLLTELMNIISVEKYQHQTVFSSAKPSIKIYASSTSANSSLTRDNTLTTKLKSSSLEKESKTSISLIFKNNHEQDLWYIIINELWSGLTIAHEQCDTAVLNKASRHIALIDTLANIDYYETPSTNLDKQSTTIREKTKQRHNEACLDMALHDLSTFTRMRQTGSFKALSVETRNVLTRRLSPSINETERHAVRCLVFTEQSDNGRSSLWCAYGSKLKVYNITTWICDPTDILFPSTVTCMCLDARNRLWVGCIQGQLFIVDTTTRICSEELTVIEGDGGCQTIGFDIINNHMLTASRSGSITIWNASNWERLNDINLCEIYKKTHDNQDKIFRSGGSVTVRRNTGASISQRNQNRNTPLYMESNGSINPNDIPNIPSPSGPAQVTPSSNDKLERIQIYEDLLFACYRDDYILILRANNSNTYTYEHIISVKYKAGDSVPIDSFIVYNKQLWVATGCIIYIFNVDNSNNRNSYDLLMKKPLDGDNLISMLGFSGYIWAGSLTGNVYIYRMDNYELYKTFAGHQGSVCCLCSMLDMYVVSGSAQTDTSIGIWENIQIENNGVTGAANRSILSSQGNSNSPRIGKKTDRKDDVVKSIDVL